MDSPTVEVEGRAGTDVKPEYVVVTAELEDGEETRESHSDKSTTDWPNS